MNTISASSIKVYQTCPLSWKFDYYYRLEKLPNDAFILGIEYHKSIERFYKGFAKEVIIETMKQSLMPSKTDKEIEMFGLVRKMFEIYCQNQIEGETIETEKKFDIEIAPDLPHLFGFIDRVDTDKIVEYKTSSFDYTEEDINNIQTDIYSYVIWKQTGQIPKVVYSVMNKKKIKTPGYKPQVLEVVRTEEDMKELVVKCREFNINVINKQFKPTPGKHCAWCAWGKYQIGNCRYAN